MSGACEYSGSQAVGTALGLLSNYVYCKRTFLFSDSAIEYVRDFKSNVNDKGLSEPDDVSAEISDWSSGIYSNSDSESSEQSPDLIPEQSFSSNPKPLPNLSDDQEFGADDCQMSQHSEDDSNHVPEVDSEEENTTETHHRVECLLTRSTPHCGSVPVVRNASGVLTVVQQVVDYHYRNLDDLQHYSLYEMTSTTCRREIKKSTAQGETKEQNLSNSDSSSDENEDAQPKSAKPRRVGRPPSRLSLFQAPHPLVESHALVFQRRFFNAQFVKRVPQYPGKRPDPITDVWKQKARRFAEFALTVYKPWQGPDGLPASTTWKAFCDWMQELRKSDTIIDRTRAAFVLNAAHNLKFDSYVSKILKWHRASNATRWADIPKELRPKAWLYGDESHLEKNISTKNSQREIDLAMQELLHHVFNASPAETKKQQMLKDTVKMYAQVIGALSSGLHSSCDSHIASLLNVIDNFAHEHVNQVHEHNIKKAAERLTDRMSKRQKHVQLLPET
jgi:hypothetical protein